MKKNYLGFIPFAVIAISCLAGCGDTSKLPTITNYQARNVPMYNSIDSDVSVGTFTIHHFNKSNVGYIQLGPIITQLLEAKSFPYTTSYEGHKYIIKNNNTLAKCIVDFDKQTIGYTSYDKYNCYETIYTPYIDNLTMSGKDFYVNTLTESKYLSTNVETVFDFTKYNIPLYFDGEVGYVPVDIIKTHLMPFFAIQLNYNGASVYLTYITDKKLESRQKFYSEGDIFDKNYMEYTYNLLALELDTIFGLDERNLRYNQQTYRYADRDIYTILSPYHDQLTSLDPNVSDNAYMDVFTTYFDDCGHTGYPTHNCLIDENAGPIHYGTELQASITISNRLSAIRKARQLDPQSIVAEQTGIEANGAIHCYQEVGDTAIITFDSFTVGSANPGTLTVNNYWLNTTNLVTYANEKIRANNNIENVIIDLSLNSGGASVAEHFIASWLCNGVTTHIRNNRDKTYAENRFYADVNHDGVYSSLDYIDPNINIYCITSIASFSCGNLLPCHLADLTNCQFIGGQSGGGSCLVWDAIPTGLGNCYQLSTPNQLGRAASKSFDDFVSAEDGITPEFYPISYSNEDISNFYDRTEILRRIHEQD